MNIVVAELTSEAGECRAADTQLIEVIVCSLVVLVSSGERRYSCNIDQNSFLSNDESVPTYHFAENTICH